MSAQPSTGPPRQREVRIITDGEVPHLARMLARAFEDDPVIAWSIPDERRRRTHGHIAFAATLRVYLRKGHVYADHGLRSAALWAPPGHWRIPPADVVRSLPQLACAYGRRLPIVLRGLSHAERHHPDDVPHWYLSFLGTDPDHQGKGLASAVLRPVLQRCDGQRLPAYLEASRATLVPFYRRHGFAVINQFHLPAGGPPVWGMWREPLPAASEPRTGGLG